MARRENSQFNELKIRDNLNGGDVLTLYYRMPTPSERQRYQNHSLQRKRNRVEFNQAQARLDGALTIVTGFKDGDFERLVDGTYQPFSSREGAADYYPEWKSWLAEHADDLLMLLAVQVYEVSVQIVDVEEDIEGK